jgi:hypothetical protein
MVEKVWAADLVDALKHLRDGFGNNVVLGEFVERAIGTGFSAGAIVAEQI